MVETDETESTFLFVYVQLYIYVDVETHLPSSTPGGPAPPSIHERQKQDDLPIFVRAFLTLSTVSIFISPVPARRLNTA